MLGVSRSIFSQITGNRFAAYPVKWLNGNMIDDPHETPVDTPKSAGQAALEQGRKAADMVDKAANVAEQTSGFFSAVKWVAIAIVMLVLFFGGYGIYKAVTVPAKAVGDAVGGMTDAVKSGGGKVMENSSEVLNRLVIAIADQGAFDRSAEAAFESLSGMTPTEPENVKDRLFRAKNFSGHENRVCYFTLNREGLSLPVTMAADNKAYETAKALGSKNERLMRIILTAGDTDVALRAQWDGENRAWILKWKSTTLKKPVEDNVAAQRATDVLEQAADTCK